MDELPFRELVGHVLEFHRRADKPSYWAMFNRQQLPEEQLIEDAECIGGLRRDPNAAPYKVKQSSVHTFLFPPQDFKMRVGDRPQRAATLWTMENGYAHCNRTSLEAINAWIDSASVEQLEAMRGHLRIGVQWDVEVTGAAGPARPTVSQAFCSALPVNYYQEVPKQLWKPFASLVLEAAYEATLYAAMGNAQRGASNIIMLTRLGGGAFGNGNEWIQGAMRRALRLFSDVNLEVRLVSQWDPSGDTLMLAREFA